MILITGASGFIGNAVAKKLSVTHAVRLAVQNNSPGTWSSEVEIFKGSLSRDQNWHAALKDVTSVVHCAARVHVTQGKFTDQITKFRQINVEGTLNLAKQAAELGVARFIFISSIKVNGESTVIGYPFTAEDVPRPQDPYGISKMEAEDKLRKLSERTGMEIVIIRPPLVYGPGVKANFASMIFWLKKGMPLPLGGIINNRRSLVYVGNLVDLICICINHPNAANQTFLVSDDDDISTAKLIRRMSLALGCSGRLVNVPQKFLNSAAKYMGNPETLKRLLGSLQVDITKTKNLLEWGPTYSMAEGFRNTAEHIPSNLKSKNSTSMKRIFDLCLVVLAICILTPIILVIAFMVRLTSKGPILYWSDRVGKKNNLFKMPKFRSMRVDTPTVATHLLLDPKVYLTPIGSFLRRSSLDELPQLWSILVGDMSFVGPRPALYNQTDLIELRSKYGLDSLSPGLTGWAQINGRDELAIPLKVALDHHYLLNQSLKLDIKILWMTFVKVISRANITH